MNLNDYLDFKTSYRMTLERKIFLMTGPRNAAGVGSLQSMSETPQELREEYRGLEAEGLVEVSGPKDLPEVNYSDVYTVSLTQKGREFLAEHQVI